MIFPALLLDGGLTSRKPDPRVASNFDRILKRGTG
jgi:hypothetical protein